MPISVGIYDKFPKMVIVPMKGTVHSAGYDAIQCLGCGMISHNKNDVESVYCGNCHKFGSILQVLTT